MILRRKCRLYSN